MVENKSPEDSDRGEMVAKSTLNTLPNGVKGILVEILYRIYTLQMGWEIDFLAVRNWMEFYYPL